MLVVSVLLLLVHTSICRLLLIVDELVRHRIVHGIHAVLVQLVQLRVLLVLLKLLVAVSLIDFLGVDREFHRHVLRVVAHGWVVGFGAVALVADLLNAHEGSQAANGSDGANC